MQKEWKMIEKCFKVLFRHDVVYNLRGSFGNFIYIFKGKSPQMKFLSESQTPK